MISFFDKVLLQSADGVEIELAKKPESGLLECKFERQPVPTILLFN